MPRHTLNSEIITLVNEANRVASFATYVDTTYVVVLNEEKYYKLVDDEGVELSKLMKGVKFKYFLEGFLVAQGIYAV